MEFINYTHDGKTVIQPAALLLSKLEQEEVLELHTLDNAIVLLKEKMTPLEKSETMCALMRMANALATDLMCGFDVDENGKEDEDDDASCDGSVPIPAEALEAAGIWGESLRIQVIDGAVVITADTEDGDD